MLDRNGNMIPGRIMDLNAIADGLAVLSRKVSETWRSEDYPQAVRSDAAQFRHALIRAQKALGKIAALADHADHERLMGAEAIKLRSELPKLLGDLIRCTAKMAEKAPGEAIALHKAYVDRAAQLAERWGH